MPRMTMLVTLLAIVAIFILAAGCSTPPTATAIQTQVPASVPATAAPTAVPTVVPTQAATTAPTVSPTAEPSVTATTAPTETPTAEPTLTTTASSSSTSSAPGGGLAQILPPGPGVTLLLGNCGSCHTTLCAVVGQRDANHWASIKVNHRDRVASMSDADYDTLMTYLSTNFNDKNPEPKLSTEQKQNSSCSAGF